MCVTLSLSAGRGGKRCSWPDAQGVAGRARLGNGRQKSRQRPKLGSLQRPRQRPPQRWDAWARSEQRVLGRTSACVPGPLPHTIPFDWACPLPHLGACFLSEGQACGSGKPGSGRLFKQAVKAGSQSRPVHRILGSRRWRLAVDGGPYWARVGTRAQPHPLPCTATHMCVCVRACVPA